METLHAVESFTESLLAKNATEHLNSEDQAIVVDVVEIIRESMFGSLDESHKADQDELLASVNVAAACNARVQGRLAPSGVVAMLETEARDLERDTAVMRDDVQKNTSAVAAARTELDGWMFGLQANAPCPEKPSIRTQSTLDGYYSSGGFAALQASFEQEKEAFDSKTLALKSADAALAAATESLHVKEATLQSAYCSWRKVLLSECVVLHDCLSAEQSNMDALRQTVEARVAARTKAYLAGQKAIGHLMYLVGQAEFHENVSVEDADRYAIDFPELPSRESCNAEGPQDDIWGSDLPLSCGDEAITSASVASMCSGRTTPGSTDWVQSSTESSTVCVAVDTSSCGYSSTPTYVTSLVGSSDHGQTSGGSEPYSETANEFTICVHFADITPSTANSLWWHVNWIAYPSAARERTDGISCAGQTPPGSTQWVQYTAHGVRVDVDTSMCGFSDLPIYVTSMGGEEQVSATTGSSEIYSSSAVGFRNYIYYGGITETKAATWKWHINWVAHPVGHQVHTGGISCAGRTSPGSTSWVSTPNGWIYVDVDTSSCGFTSTPTYVTSLVGKAAQWKSRGSSEIFMPSAEGFRIYISFPGITPEYANTRDWHVNWIADQA